MVLVQNKHIDQWDRIENTEIKPHINNKNHLIFGRVNKYNKEKTPYSIDGAGKIE